MKNSKKFNTTTKKTVLLSDLATVQVGLAFRTAAEFAPDDGVVVLHMRDVSDGERLVLGEKFTKYAVKSSKAYQVQPGDVIVKTRGAETFGAGIVSVVETEAMFAAPLLRIRANAEKMLPEYLCWYLNQKPSQDFLRMQAVGTIQKSITKQHLDMLPIIVPSMQEQRMIVEITSLQQRAMHIEKQLSTLRVRYADGWARAWIQQRS